MSLVIGIHVVVCLILIIIILIQRGRGGGFIESFSGLESMFGTKTSEFLSRTTSVMAVIFFLTCLVLAVLSLKESRSLMRGVKPKVIQPAAEAPVNPPVANQVKKEQAVPAPAPAAVTPAPAVAIPAAGGNQTVK